jgi:hypothetical protein
MRSVSFTNNTVYNNNFLANTKQTEISNIPLFNLPIPDGGNFWSDWTTPDSNNDGFVDFPYVVNPTVLDNLPWTVENGWLPKTTVSFVGDVGNDGWFISDVNVTLTASDNNPIAKTEYSLDGTNWTTYSAPFAITEEGEITIFYRSVDANGDTEKVKQDTIKVDKTAPTITASRTPEPNVNGWNKTDVVIAFSCDDSSSGIDICSDDVTVSNDGANQTVTGTGTDKAGNSASVTIEGINIDRTGPIVTINTPGENAEYSQNQVVLADWQAVDSLSGIISVSATQENGQAIDTATFGQKTFTINTADKAGNVTEETVTYRIIYDFSGFLSPVKDAKGYKSGSTIPIKFQLKDGLGNFITNAEAKLFVVGPDGQEHEATSNANEGNIARAAGDQYIYNLSTKNFAPGDWTILLRLDDGTTKTLPIILK